ncbi:hypothetical protein COM81_29665 [Priestia megaterium]|jgi:uncharacterized protein (TIGR01732 family)|nr:hypothetical protein COM81_29665 [Priestia megaterium]PFI91729.1 hypothetical protein COI84_21160 [Priestia megaterium]PGR04683.1 hypothetical protein COC62_29950 [Priestia megaterium]
MLVICTYNAITHVYLKFFPLIKYHKRGVYMSSYGGFGSGFALLVVLFILLIIIGCSCYGGFGGY